MLNPDDIYPTLNLKWLLESWLENAGDKDMVILQLRIILWISLIINLLYGNKRENNKAYS